jgi:hypothetical protein
MARASSRLVLPVLRVYRSQKCGQGASPANSWPPAGPVVGLRRVFAVKFPDYNGDNWLLTPIAGFVDLSFLRLLA